MVKSCSFSKSVIFPGTVRDVAVFIPAQYDGSKPACVYVKTDGYNPVEKTLLETLIATKEMPVTIGVFVTPGDLPATVKNTMGRRNRCFEYDGMGDNNVRFLVEEILPFVAKEFDLKLPPAATIVASPAAAAAASRLSMPPGNVPTHSAASMPTAAASSPFAAATSFPRWSASSRPSRFAPISPPARSDMENCAGDWFLLDQEMDKALRFSGYDYRFRIINGGHVRRL